LRVIGISDSHNSTASLYEDGRLLAAVAEGRLRRVKNWMGFPEQAINECLRIADRRLEDVDLVALNGSAVPFPYHTREDIISAFKGSDRNGLHLNRAQRALVQMFYKGRLKDLYRSTSVWQTRDRERWRD
jgi:predicted NodU family carbamoyl transferase